MFKPLPFGVWITESLCVIRFLGDHERVKKVWVEGNLTVPYIGDFEECYQQLADDLAGGQHFLVYSTHPSLSPDQRNALGKFLSLLEITSQNAPKVPGKWTDSIALVHSDLWPPLEEAAKAVVRAFEGWEPPPEDKK